MQRSNGSKLLTLSAALALVTLLLPAPAASQTLLAQDSDPVKMGWMQGFPPVQSKRITQPDSNFFSFPKLRWSVCNMRQLMPTTNISRAINHYQPLVFSPLADIDNLSFTPLNSKQSMTWQQSLMANYTDGILVLHQGKVVYERYFGCLNETEYHAAMSMTKSVTGLLAEMFIAQGKLDDTAKVADIIPALAGSAFADATVRQVMNMTTALAYSEDYADPKADIWQYSYAANPLPKPDNYIGPVGYFDYLKTVKKAGEHGAAFGYKTVNSDVLGWILATVSQKPLNQLVSEMLWQPIGMAQDAYMTVDSLGTPFAGGGLSATLRDMAKLGQAMLNNGQVNNVQVIPQQAISSIRQGGDHEVFAKANYSTLPNGSYKSMWWLLHNKHNAFAARGVHGQTVYIDPTAQMVIVRFASHPIAANGANDPTSLPAYQALAEYLLQHKND